jgi:hypothetical protein
MRTDMYTRALLTVIAACLVYLSLGSPAIFSPARAQSGSQAPLSAPRETIRIEPLDATHVRLRRSDSDWVLDSAGITISPTWDGPPGGSVRLLAMPPGRVTAPGLTFVVQEYELMITPSGIVGTSFGGDQRKK